MNYPETWHEESFFECFHVLTRVIEKSDNNLEELGLLILKLASLAGGQMLADAINPMAWPPCRTQTCSDCWIATTGMCAHRNTPADLRNAAIASIEALKSTSTTEAKELLGHFSGFDKTDPIILETLIHQSRLALKETNYARKPQGDQAIQCPTDQHSQDSKRPSNKMDE